VLSRRFADQNGIGYAPISREVGLPDGSRLPASRSDPVDLTVAIVTRRESAVVVDLTAFDCILGIPWLEDLSPIVSWKRKKLLVPTPGGPVEVNLDENPCRVVGGSPSFLSTLRLQDAAKKGEPIYMVTMKAVDDGARSTSNDCAPLPAEWARLIQGYADVFPDDHPGLPPIAPCS
jgi:hypothetical protein